MYRQESPHRSSLGGINANVLAMLAYLASAVVSFIPVLRYLSWFAPLILFFLEKESGFVRFHAMQAFLLNVLGTVLSIVMAIVGGIMGVGVWLSFGLLAGGYAVLAIISFLLGLVILICAIVALVKAYGYVAYPIPVLGPLAARLSGYM